MAKLCAVCNEKTDSDDHFSVEGAEGDIEVHTYCLDEFNQHPEKYGGTATTRKEPEIAQEFEPPSPSTMKERFSLTIHWLGTVILMIGLYLYPTVATVIYVQGGVSSDQEIIEILLIAYAAITGIFFLCW